MAGEGAHGPMGRIRWPGFQGGIQNSLTQLGRRHPPGAFAFPPPPERLDAAAPKRRPRCNHGGARQAGLLRYRAIRHPRSLGDLRPGSISAVIRRCGKPTCHCAKPNDPGHDPQLRLTQTVNGKTVAESFASPTAFQKAQAEVHEYHRWQRLCVELVDVSERICRRRPSRHSRRSGARRKKTSLETSVP
jgi:hypothetical protein